MSRITRALKATYNFISGDVVTMAATLVAFALGGALIGFGHVSPGLVAVVFVAVIVAGLISTLWREAASRPRNRSS